MVITNQELKPWSHHVHHHENELRSLKKNQQKKTNKIPRNSLTKPAWYWTS